MFYKSFPLQSQDKLTWQEIYLTPKDEKLAEENAAETNNNLMKKCIEDAKQILNDKKFKLVQSSIISIALQLFAKRADHVVYFKEKKCREIFNKINKRNN